MAVRDEFRPLEDLGEGLIRDQYIGNARHLSFRLRSRPGVNGLSHDRCLDQSHVVEPP